MDKMLTTRYKTDNTSSSLAALVNLINEETAEELAVLYQERWEIETALDELKTHLRGAKIVLRSKTPELVRQEFYGLLLAPFAMRGLMHEAAIKGIHRGQRERLPGPPHLVGKFPDATEKILLLLLAIAFHVNDDIRRAFLVAIEDAIQEILQILQSMAVAAN